MIATAEPVARSQQQQIALDALFKRIGEVSSLPAAAVRILRVANDETAGVAELLEVVEGDPALAIRILRAVNSSFYSVRNRVADLKTAMTLLGLKQLRNLALTVHVSRLFSTPGDYRSYSREALWKHQVAVAATTRLIAEVCAAAPPDEAYVAGLLHDIGFILLDQHLHLPFKQVLDKIDPFTSTTSIEQQILSFDHTELGEYVARRWNFAEPVCAAARYHHTPQSYNGPHEKIVTMVSVANYLCSRHNLTSLGVHNVPAPADEVYRGLGMHADRWAAVVERFDATLAMATATAAI